MILMTQGVVSDQHPPAHLGFVLVGASLWVARLHVRCRLPSPCERRCDVEGCALAAFPIWASPLVGSHIYNPSHHFPPWNIMHHGILALIHFAIGISSHFQYITWSFIILCSPFCFYLLVSFSFYLFPIFLHFITSLHSTTSYTFPIPRLHSFFSILFSLLFFTLVPQFWVTPFSTTCVTSYILTLSVCCLCWLLSPCYASSAPSWAVLSVLWFAWPHHYCSDVYVSFEG